MSDQIKDGGSAFPIPFAQVMSEDGKGMSLRDWFAGMAMQGILASGEYGARRMRENFKCDCGRMAYMAADEMLAAREGKEEA